MDQDALLDRPWLEELTAEQDPVRMIASAENYILAIDTLGWTPERWQRITTMLLVVALLGEQPGEGGTA